MESQNESLSEEGNSDSHRHQSGSLREVATIAWPIVVSMLSYTAMGVADTLLVGRIGVTELAAVGLATTLVFLVNSFFMGTLHGVKVVAAQATGAGKDGIARLAGWHGILIALPFGFFVVFLSGFDAWLFELMGGPPHVQEVAREYFVIRVMASPFFYVLLAASDYYQGTGDTKTPMKINLWVNGLNIVLDIVLIFGLGPFPRLEIQGAAIATVIAVVVGMLMILFRFIQDVGMLTKVDIAMFGKVLKVGVPIGVRYTLDIGGFTVFTAIVARMGEAELAANQIAIKIISLSFLPGYGISEAATVLTGQYVGAGKNREVVRSFVNALKLSVGVMGACGVIFWFFPEPLIALFQDDAEVTRIAIQLLFLAAFFQVFDAVAMTASGALNGTGDTRFTMFTSIGGSWLVLVPLTYAFGVYLEWGAFGAWLALTVEIMVIAVVLTVRFRTGGWKKHAVI